MGPIRRGCAPGRAAVRSVDETSCLFVPAGEDLFHVLVRLMVWFFFVNDVKGEVCLDRR